MIGASPGGFGTILSQNAWLPVLRTLRADFWAEGRLMVSRAQTVFNQDGDITDQKIEEQLRNISRASSPMFVPPAKCTDALSL